MSMSIITGTEYVDYVSKKTNERVKGYRISYIRLSSNERVAGMQSELPLWVNSRSRFFSQIDGIVTPGDAADIVLEADAYGRNNLAYFCRYGDKPIIDFKEVISCLKE